MIVRRLTESLLLVSDTSWKDVASLSRVLNASIYPGVEEVTASYDTLGIYGKPEPGWDKWVSEAAETAYYGNPQVYEIPVCYEMGEDLSSVSLRLGIDSGEVIRLHSASEYRCFSVGFQPGFGYLGPLPEKLRGLERREVPRSRVESGSVGICQDQTAVYPGVSPGGWNLIGRCPLEIVNIEDGYFPIQAGDTIRFRQIDGTEFEQLKCQRLT
ncbi:MAG: carboxyltransferase domain-containing protein [Chthonomonas sp.]|nr:carboxyltransferase domain-containing protein [Chthonomonas sp.]